MTDIARLLIQLEDIRPPVRRRIEVPLDIRLDDLHLVVQAAMGWENCHLYEFRVGGRDGPAYGVPDPDGVFTESDPRPARKANLADLLAQLSTRTRAFKYVYDFGDDWRHSVKLEAIAAADPDIAYPHLLRAERACPPEDVGGPWGYARYLEAIANPAHPEHADMIEWRGAAFDPAVADEAEIRRRMKRIATRLGNRRGRTAGKTGGKTGGTTAG